MRIALALALAAVASATAGAQDARRSGFDDMSPATQAMQRDDAQNPALLFAADGALAWHEAPASGARSCAGCHGDAAEAMRGIAVRYPAFDATLGRPLALGERIDTCRTRHQRAPAWGAESPPRLALEAFVALQSRGLPLAPPDDPRLAPHVARGEARWRERIGQLDLACRHCHDAHAGSRLGGSVIPQGHPTAYPVYRLEWQALGSLQRRLRNCYQGVRAGLPAFGAPELVELELHLARRAAGMRWEAPGVRP